MVVEFTARQVEVSETYLKDGATEGVDRIALVLGKITSAMFRFWAERHLTNRRIDAPKPSPQYRGQRRVCQPGDSPARGSGSRRAPGAPLSRQELAPAKRLPKVAPTAETRGPRKTGRALLAAKAEAAAESNGDASQNGHKPAIARAPGKQTKAAITVHSFPGKPTMVEPHILSAAEALAIRPMTIEEAVKEAEFRDRDLLIFRNLAGDMFVLHRRRDGKMELVEIPA